MTNLNETILQNYGGLNQNSLISILNLDTEQESETSVLSQMIRNSPYYDNEQFTKLINEKQGNKHFTILSTNIESVNAKIDELIIFIETLREVNFEFSAICLQECWITDDANLSHIQIEGYTFISNQSIVGRKGGLITFLNNKYNYKTLSHQNLSTIWEGQFLEINGFELNKKLLLGNIYRPPRNSQENYNIFMNDMKSILTSYERLNFDFIFAGDFNMNLLEVNDKDAITEFFDLITSFSFFPKITLPTRFTNNNGTLIDNFFCKLTQSTLSSYSGILLKQFSDHQPYFLYIDIKQQHLANPKMIKVCNQSIENLKQFYEDLQQKDMMSIIDQNPNTDPNLNYDALSSMINNSQEKCIPTKFVKFKKYKHKNSKWITKGIIKSIKYRDNLYKKIKLTSSDTPEHNIQKTNLLCYNKILKKEYKISQKIIFFVLFQKVQK